MVDETTVAVDTNTDEEVVLDETTDMEDVDAIRQQLAEAEEAKRQLTARAHKAEAELKARKAEVTPLAPLATNSGLDSDAVDVKILQSQGMSEELITELKALAKVRGTSILATQLDPIFVEIKKSKDAEEKSKKASLPASRGSGSPTAKKSFNSSGLTDAEHKELWLKHQGR